jgi:hypothetical protein
VSESAYLPFDLRRRYLDALLFCTVQYEAPYLHGQRGCMPALDLTFKSGAVSMANCPSRSFFSLSAPSFRRCSAASPWPSEIAS